MRCGIEFVNLMLAELNAMVFPAHVRVVDVRRGKLCLIVMSINRYVVTVEEIVQIFIADSMLDQIVV